MSALTKINGLDHTILLNKEAVTETSKVSTTDSPLYLGPGSTTVPGVTNLYYSISNLFDECKALYAANKIGDREGVVDNGLRIIQTPFSFSNALMQLFFNTLCAGEYFKILSYPSLPFLTNKVGPLALCIAITGFILCGIEGVLETLGLFQTASFLKKNYPFEIEELREVLKGNTTPQRETKYFLLLHKIAQLPLPKEVFDEINSEFPEDANQTFKILHENILLLKLKNIQESYFQLSSKKMNKIDDYVEKTLFPLPVQEQNKRKEQIVKTQLECKESRLTRRVHPWLQERIKRELPTLLKCLQSPIASERESAAEKAEDIFTHLKIQSHKKLLIHIIGLFAVLLTVAGLIAGCITCPFFIPMILLLLGGGLSIARGLLDAGYMNSEGWNFSAYACVPETLKEIYNWATAPKKCELSFFYDQGQRAAAKKAYKEALSKLSFKIGPYPSLTPSQAAAKEAYKEALSKLSFKIGPYPSLTPSQAAAKEAYKEAIASLRF